MPLLEETLLEALIEERRLSEERALIPGLLKHDLGNVLTHVTLASDFLSQAADRTQREDMLREVQGGLKRLRELLAGMEFLFQSREGASDYARGDLAAFISELVVTPGVWPPGGPITLKLPATMWCSFSPALMRHALVNLIGNAVAYSQRTWIRVRLARVCDDCWQIAIANGGPGIPAGHIPYLFSIRPSEGTLTKSSRSGLGLYIARTCVRNHGATLRVRTRPHLTVFSFVVQGSQRAPVPPGAPE